MDNMSMDNELMDNELEEINIFFAHNLNQDAICLKLDNCRKNLPDTILLLQTLKDAKTKLETTPKLKRERDYQKIKDKVEYLIEVFSDPSHQITGIHALLKQLKNETYT